MLAKNSIEPAGLIFKFCLEKSPNNLAALLGQACFYFNSGNFRGALNNFQLILRANPEFNEIRAAIGFCFLKLGFKEMAFKAFSRVLQVDPGNESAMLALGFLQLDKESQLQAGLLQMKTVFQLNRSNAVTQIHLANHFFFKKDNQKAKSLAGGALEHAPSDKIKSEAYFILAKISHVAGNFSEALGNYQLASKLAPDFLPALYGLGQCFLARGDFEGAGMMFDKILESEPSCPEVLRLSTFINCSKLAKMPIGSDHLKARLELIDKIKISLPRVLALFPEDLLLLQCAAVIYEITDQEKAADLYTKSKADESNNFAVLNNFAILKKRPELLKKAQNLCTNQDRTFKLYLKFNEACLLEMNLSSDSVDSEDIVTGIYKEILAEEGNFGLAHLRLGLGCFRRGQLSEAADHFKDALGSGNDQNRDAWNCLAAINLKQKAFGPARKSFERVLQNIDKNDPYALVALGNIYGELARQDKKHVRFDEYHKRAGEFYGKALNLDKGNYFAAQGIGMIYADRGMATEAREVFTQVRSASIKTFSLDSTLNQAHALVEMGKYAAAINLYSQAIESASTKNVNNNNTTTDNNTSSKLVSLLLYRCRAQYLLTMESFDLSACDSAISDAQQALKILPNDEPLKFNLGLLLQARASAVSKSQSESNLFDSALENVGDAEEVFKVILKNGKMDQKLLESRLALCPSLIKSIQQKAAMSEKALKEQVDRLKNLKIQRQAQLEKDSQIQAQKEALEREKLAEIEKNRKELAAKMRETEEKVKAASFTIYKKSKNEDDESSGNEEGENNFKIKKRKKRLRTSEAEAETEDDNDGVTKGRRRAKVGSNVPLLSKEFISSSDEEDEKAPMN